MFEILLWDILLLFDNFLLNCLVVSDIYFYLCAEINYCLTIKKKINKRLKIYCTLLLVVILAVVLTSIFHFEMSRSYRIYPVEKLFFDSGCREVASRDTLEGGVVRTSYKPT